MEQSTTIMRLSTDTGKDLEVFEKELTSYAQMQGKQDAGNNKPKVLDEFTAYIKNHVQITVQEKMNQNQSEFLPISGMVVAKQIEEAGHTLAKEITGEINDLEHSLKGLADRKKATTPDLKKRQWRKVAGLVVIAMSVLEGIINYGALRQGSFSKGAALSIALALTLALAFTTHIVAEYIKRSSSQKQLITRTALVLVPAFLLFFVLGKLRSDGLATASALAYQTGQAQATSSGNSPLAIALISFFIYGLALLISTRYAKDAREKAEDSAYERACWEHDDVTKKIGELGVKKANVEKETKEKVATALATWEHALARELHLESIAKKALEVYAASNLRHRTDGVCPPFFSTLPECTFSKFFHQTNTQ